MENKAIKGFYVNTLSQVESTADKLGLTLVPRSVAGMFGETTGTTYEIETSSGKFKIYHGPFHLKRKEPYISIPIDFEVSSINKTYVAVDSRSMNKQSLNAQESSTLGMFVQSLQHATDSINILAGTAIAIGKRFHEFTVFNPQTEAPIFNEEVELELLCSLYSHIGNQSSSRGILLSGTYGTGKSSISSYVAHLAISKGYTFMSLQDSSMYPAALKVADTVAGLVLFVEDMDEQIDSDRNRELNAILNAMDSVDTRNRKVISIFTTNDIDSMDRAFLRPGRMDAVINLPESSPEVVQKILNRYTKEVVPMELATSLGVRNPSFLKEISTRALFLSNHLGISVLEALPKAANMMKEHLTIVNKPRKKEALSLEDIVKRVDSI